MESLKEDCADLLLDVWLRLYEQTEQDQAEEIGVAVGVAKLVHDAIHETEPGLIVQLGRDFFEELDVLLFFLLSLLAYFLLITGLLCDEEDDGVDHRRVWHDSTIDALLTGHHLEADLSDQLWISRAEVCLQIVFEVVHAEIRLVVAQNARISYIVHCVHFEILRERARRLDRLRECG